MPGRIDTRTEYYEKCASERSVLSLLVHTIISVHKKLTIIKSVRPILCKCTQKLSINKSVLPILGQE